MRRSIVSIEYKYMPGINNPADNSQPGQSDWSERQLRGFEYTSGELRFPPELKEFGHNDRWQISMEGVIDSPPEVGPTQDPDFPYPGVMLAYYNMERFVIRNRTGRKQIDVLSLTPENWKQRMAVAANAGFSPITAEAVQGYTYFDEKEREMVWGNGILESRAYGVENFPKYVVMNLLLARHREEIGTPFNEETDSKVKSKIVEKTEEIFKSWDDPGDHQDIKALIRNAFEQ